MKTSMQAAKRYIIIAIKKNTTGINIVKGSHTMRNIEDHGRKILAMERKLLLLVAGFLLSQFESCNADPARAMFVFGDSYADIGNLPINISIVSPWKNPYGVSWPGQPSGRFSSGKIQTDYIAQILGLPSPITYRMIKNSKRSKTALKGINFAVSGSGVFDNVFGFATPNLSVQVGHFKDIIRSQRYDSHHLKRSIVLLTVDGNDYGAQNFTEGIVDTVIAEVKFQLQELYNLGLRNFLVSNVLSFDCLPIYRRFGKVCMNSSMHLVTTHNKYLSQAVSKLRKLDDANFLILDFFAAFSHIISEPSMHGIHNLNRSCCSSNDPASLLGCGDFDGGKALYKLCKHPERYFFFDWFHPTQKGWEAVVNLYYSYQGFVQDGSSSSTSLAKWLHSPRVAFDSSPPNFS